MNAQQTMPIQFIFWLPSELLTTEESGFGSETLPTLGSETPLETSEDELESAPARSLETARDELEGTAGLHVRREDALLGAFEDGGAFEDAGGAEEGGAEEVEAGGGDVGVGVSGLEAGGLEVWLTSPTEGGACDPTAAKTLIELENTIAANITKMDSTFLRLLI